MSRITKHEFEPEEVMAYLDGELAPARAAALASHLDHCDECRAVATQFRQVSERLLDFGVEAARESLNATVIRAASIAAITVRPTKPAAWRVGLASPYTWVLACLLILALVGRFGVPNLLRLGGASRSASYSVDDVQVSPYMSKLTAPAASRSAASEPVFSETRIARAGGGESGDGGTIEAPALAGPMIAQTVSFTIVANNYDQASAAIDRLASSHGGYVQKLTAEARAGAPRALSVTLRVPAAQLSDSIAELRKLGHVEQETRANDEVTDQYVDLQARLKSARATEQRLLQLLETRTGKLEDVLAVEQELARIREEIEGMDGQRVVLLHRVNYVTVEVGLREEYHEQLHPGSASTATGLRNSLVEGLRNLEDGVISVLIFLFAYGPSILFWCALFLTPGFFIWRRRRSRARG